MRMLVTGANGQVGCELVRRGRAAGHEVLALDRAALDIRDARAVARAVAESGAEVVVNAAAYTAVDRAEEEPEAAFAVNRDGAAHLAAACRQSGLALLHLSTDYVFDGANAAPYREDDPVAPLGVYGRSKWEGEQAVREALPAHLILRVSWVFGAHGHNFVKTMLRLARERDVLQVVADQHGCPTYAGDIADTLLELAGRIAASLPPPPDLPLAKGEERKTAEKGGQAGFWGTYHYCGGPPTTWHGFAQAIVETARGQEPLKACEVVAIATADYPTPARRPANSMLDCTRIEERLGIAQCPWLDGLRAMLKELHA